MCWSSSDATIFCNNLARWLQRIVSTRPRNPRIPIARFDIQPAFHTRMIIFQSGISGSGRNMMCWFSSDAMTFCNNFARWLQKIVATCDVLFFLGCYDLFWRALWNVHMAWATLSSFWCNLVIVQTTRQSLGPRYVVWNFVGLSEQ